MKPKLKIQIIIVFVINFIGAMVMADSDNEKFPLLSSKQKNISFVFEDSALNFSTFAPKAFIWNKSDEVPPEFVDAAVFSAFSQNYIGYDPLNRDRFEVRIYAARIFPTRIALGTGYAALLAIRWGQLNFGVRAHNPEFGEVLGGDNSSGVMMVNRISVFRRGEYLLIVRIKFNADYYEQYARDMAAFIGSLEFDAPLKEDPIKKAFKTSTIQDGAKTITFDYEMPGNWEELVFEKNDLDFPVQADLWLDTGDPQRNSGAMIAVAPALGSIPEGATFKADEQEQANLAGIVAEVTVRNLLPDQPFKLQPEKKNGFTHFNETTYFNKLYVFSGKVEKNNLPIAISVLMTLGKDRTSIYTAVLTTATNDLYHRGTHNHADFVLGLLLDAQYEHWKKINGSDQ